MTDRLSLSFIFLKFSSKKTKVTFQPGIHVIYGESGVGKTRLVQLLLGIQKPYPGNFHLEIHRRPDQVQVVLQNPDSQIISPTIDGELAFSLECFETNPSVIQSCLIELKKKLPFKARGDRHPATLSGGEKEMLNLVTTFSTNPSLVLMDDCLSFLNQRKKEEMLEQVRRCASVNNCIILWMTSDISDLMYGDTRWELSLSSFTSLNQWEDPIYPHKVLNKGSMSLEADTLSFAYPDSPSLFNSLSLKIEQVRSLGLVGLNGSGKTTFASLILGIYKPVEGSLRIRLLDNKSTELGYLDQFPERLIGASTLNNFLEELLVAGKILSHNRNKCIKVLGHQQINWEMMKDRSTLDIPWSTLRMALIIILTHCEYDVLILDEPTFGLGWKQKLNLHRYLHTYLNKKHLVFVSHDIDFVKSTCDVIFSLDDGIVKYSNNIQIER